MSVRPEDHFDGAVARPKLKDGSVFRRCAAAIAAVVMVVGLVLVALATSAPADALASKLATGSYSDTVVDSAQDRIFFSGNASDTDTPGYSGVEYADLSGGPLHRVAGVSSGGDMAMAPGGGMIYVVGDGKVQALDTATFSVQTFPVTQVSCLQDIAATTGYVWFIYSCDSAGRSVAANLAVLNVADGSVAPDQLDLTAPSEVQLASVPAASDRMALLMSGDSGTAARLTMLTASGGAVAESVHVDLGHHAATALALSSDATRVLVGDANKTREFRTADLSSIRTFSTPQGTPLSVGFSPDGKTIAVAADYWWATDRSYVGYGGAINVFREASGARLHTYDYRETYTDTDVVNGTSPRAVEWSGNTLYVTYVNYLGERPTTHRFPGATLAPVAVSLSAPSHPQRGAAVRVVGTLHSTGSAVRHAFIAVSRTDQSGTHKVGRAQTSGVGRFAITDHPPVGGKVSYTASYAGDATHASATEAVKIDVQRAKTTLRLTPPDGIVRFNSPATVRIHLGKTFNGRAITVYAKPYGAASQKTRIKTVKVDRRGDAKVTRRLAVRTKFTASFAGDYRYAARKASTTVKVQAKLRSAMANDGRTDGKYHEYGQKKGARIVAQVLPPKSSTCLDFVMQQNTGKGWHNAVVECYDMDSKGIADAYADGPSATHYRIRAQFRGDRWNTAVKGKWYYIEFI